MLNVDRLEKAVRKETSLLQSKTAQQLVGANNRAHFVLTKRLDVHAREHHREKRAVVRMEQKLRTDMQRIRKVSSPSPTTAIRKGSDGELFVFGDGAKLLPLRSHPSSVDDVDISPIRDGAATARLRPKSGSAFARRHVSTKSCGSLDDSSLSSSSRGDVVTDNRFQALLSLLPARPGRAENEYRKACGNRWYRPSLDSGSLA